MSATNYKNRWVDMIVQTVLSGLVMLLIAWWTLSKADAKELIEKLNDKADIELVKEYNEAAINYVDGRFENHILTEQRAYNNLEKIIILNMNEVKAIIEGFEKYMESVDKRLERIEDKN